MDIKQQNRALNFSTIDGAFSAIMGSLAGGIFLIGFALKILNATPGQIGVLASLPMLANLIQILGSIIIEKTGKKKKLCFMCVLASRLMWLAIIMLPLAIFSQVSDWRIWVLVAVITLSSLFASLSGVAWLAWMSDLVPENIRGTYFGKRNMISSFCGMLAVILAGKFITKWESVFAETNPYGFIIIFAVGLISGLIATWFLARIPEVKDDKKADNKGFDFSLFFKPLKDKNFLMLILFASSWIFAIQLAGPFYGVFMIENLKINFSNMAIFATFATFATLFMMKIWGPISDKLGNKPVIIVSGLVLIIVPFIWVLASPNNYYIPVLIAHILSGAFMAGILLSQFNIMIKLSPKEGRSVYLALFAAITGATGAMAPIVGGVLSKVLEGFSYAIATYSITNFQLIFLISSVLQIFTIFLILKVREPASATPVAVILQLKNDLNPQVGVGGATDFLMVELKKRKNILKKIDSITDKAVEASERKIGKVLEKGEKFIDKPVKKLKDFLKDEDD